MSGVFLVFEGIDGTGKTTVSTKVAALLRKQGVSVSHRREHGEYKNAVAESVRLITRDRRNLFLSPQAELFLNLARDAASLTPVEDDVVVSDRYGVSYEALAQARGMPLTEVLAASHFSTMPEPDRIIILDLETVDARVRKRVGKLRAGREKPMGGRKGLLGQGLRDRQRRLLMERAAQEPGRYLVVDAFLKNVDAVTQDVLKGLADCIPQAKEAAKAVKACSRGSWPHEGLGEAARAQDGASYVEAFFAGLKQVSGVDPNLALYLTTGLNLEEAWKLRDQLKARAPELCAASLAGVGGERARELLAKLVKKAPRQVALAAGGRLRNRELLRRCVRKAGPTVALALTGRDDPEAWVLRELLAGDHPNEVLRSLRSLDNDAAWALREQLFVAGDVVSDDAMARSLGGRVDDRGYLEGLLSRAPVGVLGALAGREDDFARSVFAAHIGVAPKAVMRAITRKDGDWAWALRQQAGDWAKEVLDSVDRLDTEPAWELRQRLADVFPNTAVSSIGAGNRENRAWAFRWAQAERYPSNMLLAKHIVRAFTQQRKKDADA